MTENQPSQRLSEDGVVIDWAEESYSVWLGGFLAEAGLRFFELDLSFERFYDRCRFAISAVAEEAANVGPVVHGTALRHDRLEAGLVSSFVCHFRIAPSLPFP